MYQRGRGSPGHLSFRQCGGMTEVRRDCPSLVEVPIIR